jgi:dethiobiotin synthetase/adenosylmethionine--8-amino-7-oxononanoate aminotransferase
MSELPIVEQTFSLGTVLSITLDVDDDESGDNECSLINVAIRLLRKECVFARSLGNVMYILVSPPDNPEDCLHLSKKVYDTLSKLSGARSMSSMKQ